MNARHNTDLILHRLSTLPKKLLKLQHTQYLSDFLLHELCQDCFTLSRAAYLVDNPDFNCLQGVSGFWSNEVYAADCWQHPNLFIEHMQKAPFNQQVKKYSRCSLKKESLLDQNTINSVAKDLNFVDPAFHNFELKHDNHGIFIFEKPTKCDLVDKHLEDSLYYFSFCPITHS